MDDQLDSNSQQFRFYDDQSQSKMNSIQGMDKQLDEKVPQKVEIKKINHIQQYTSFFNDIQDEVDSYIHKSMQNYQSRLQHKLVILNQNHDFHKLICFQKPSIYLVGYCFGGVIVKYQAIIGNYKLSIDLLNMSQESPKCSIKIGEGSFGEIYLVSKIKKKNIICKRKNFKDNNKNNQYLNFLNKKQQIEEFICEFTIYKICSFYQICPQVTNAVGFDLVCFLDSIEFYMELCLSLKFNYKNLEKDMKINVRILHKLKIIHKDLKPTNMLYSFAYKRFVLCDFGLSHSIQEQLGQLTSTYKEGTMSYASPQMLNIKKGQQKQIDLYYNDMYGLKISLFEFRNFYNEHQYPKAICSQNYQMQNIYKIVLLFHIAITKDPKDTIKFLNQNEIRFENLNESFVKIIYSKISQINRNQIHINSENLKKLICKYSSYSQNSINLQFIRRCYGAGVRFKLELQLIKKEELIDQFEQTEQQIYYINLNQIQRLSALGQARLCQLIIQKNIKYLSQKKQKSNSIIKYIIELYLLIYELRLKFSLKNVIKITKDFLEIEKYKQKISYNQIRFKRIQFINKIFLKSNNRITLCIHQYLQHHPQQKIIIYQYTLYVLDIIRNINLSLTYKLLLLEQYKKEQVQYKLKILKLVNQIMQNYHSIKKIQESINYTNQMIQLINYHKMDAMLTNQSIKIDYLGYFGNIHRIQGEYKQALKYYYSQLRQTQIYYGDNYINLSNCFLNIGICYFELKDYNMAEKYWKKQLEIINLYPQQQIKLYHCKYNLSKLLLLEGKQQEFLFHFCAISDLIGKIQVTKQSKYKQLQYFYMYSEYYSNFQQSYQLSKEAINNKNSQAFQKYYQKSKAILNKLIAKTSWQKSFLQQIQNKQFSNTNLLTILEDIKKLSEKKSQILKSYVEKIFELTFHQKQICITNEFSFLNTLQVYLSVFPIQNHQLKIQFYKNISEYQYFENELQKCLFHLQKQYSLIMNTSKDQNIELRQQCIYKAALVSQKLKLYLKSNFYAEKFIRFEKHTYNKKILDLMCQNYININNKKKLVATLFKKCRSKQPNLKCYTDLCNICLQTKQKQLYAIFNTYFQIFVDNKSNSPNFLPQYQICTLIYKNQFINTNIELIFQLIKYCKKIMILKRKTNCLRKIKKETLQGNINKYLFSIK